MLNTRRNEIYNNNDVVNSNDLRRRIANIDSRFRTTYYDSTSNFTYKFETPYKNVIRVRIASIEIPKSWYTFNKTLYKNTYFSLIFTDFENIPHKVTVEIPNGNYTCKELIDEIQTQLIATILIPYGVLFSITENKRLSKTVISQMGSVNKLVGTWPPTCFTWEYLQQNYVTKPATPFEIDFKVDEYKYRMYNNGLGYNLGFRGSHYIVEKPGDIPNSMYICSEACIDIVGDTYCFLSIDDFNIVQQKTHNNNFECMAKIVMKDTMNGVQFNDNCRFLTNDIIFPSPIDVAQVRVKLIDPYGIVMDMNDINLSFTLEFTEVMNTKMYEFYRNYIWLGNIPSLPQDVRGAGVPLLGGRGP